MAVMTEPSLSDAAIARIAAGLLDRSLPKAEWTHAGHFAAALWLLRWQQGFDGPRDLPAIIRAYNEATGGVNSDSEGYHETITLASIRAASAALADGAGAPLSEILATLLAGPLGRSDWPLGYWHEDTLFSVAARRDWVEPDRAALPF
ncbi:hypothetical protein IP88_14395 [alpha proteobacterium AAP81b]|nr:hypothetical protein IP88_14395 [alpha proteobacterium AAP81b]